MKRRLPILVLTTLTMMALISVVFATPSQTRVDGAVQISGIGAYSGPGECTDPEGQGASYALTLNGSLSGCHYTFVETARCSEGGTYFEAGTETFVGLYNGAYGTFGTTYVYTAKFKDCSNLGGEVVGRCQHPIIRGSGTGAFAGVIGRLDFKDDIQTGTFPYRGHLLF